MRKGLCGVLLAALVLAAAPPLAARPSLRSSSSSDVAEVICNGGFEDGDACWTQQSDAGDEATVTYGVSHEGIASALFCSEVASGCNSGYIQVLDVPIGVRTGTLSAYLRGTTDDDVNDCSTLVQVSMFDTTEEEPTVIKLQMCENALQNSSNEWVLRSRTRAVTSFLQAHEGKEILLFARGQVEPGYTGSFGADDISLSITSAAPLAIYRRSIDLQMVGHLRARGDLSLVEDGPARCFANIDVKIQRRSNGDWDLVKRTKTDETAAFASRLPDRRGRYRAVTPAITFSDAKKCAKTVSPTERHFHRGGR